MKHILLFFLLAALAAPGSLLAQKPKKQKKKEAAEAAAAPKDFGVESSEVFKKHFTGFALFDPERDTMLVEFNSEKYFTPASNIKILTLYTALRTLGDSIPALLYREEGDLLVFWGTGDPSFLNPHLQQNPLVFNFLRNSAKPLLFCPANWRGERYGAGWMWGDFPYDYQPEKSPFPAYGNLAHFRQDSAASGISAAPAFLKKDLRLDPALDPEDFAGREEFDNRFTFNTPAAMGKPFEYGVPFRWSPAFLAQVLADTLRRPVQVLEADLPPPPDARVLYSLRADSLYRLMMHESDNFVAEQLLLLCSWQKFGALNTELMIDFAKKSHLADLPDEPRWVDGSGLSRYNLLTPRSIVKLLLKLWKTVPTERLLGIFPAGGVNGTIKTNYRNGSQPYVFAKTGTLRHHHCLSGYLLTKKGKVLIFSFMHGGVTDGFSPVKREMERVLEGIREAF